jgi:4'-phosphopantetheinyl transferase EntD
VQSLLASLLPAGIAFAEASGDELDGPLPPLWPGEEGGLGPRAVHRRRVSYHWGRALARRAIESLGQEVAAVGRGPSRQPIWPAGVVGSITHCDGYCAAAAAPSAQWLGVGIDAEPLQEMAAGVVARIATEDECSRLAGRDDRPRATVALFSAKESLYKVWSPIARSWLGFHDATVDLGELAPARPATATAPATAPARPDGAEDAGEAALVGPLTARLLVPPLAVAGRRVGRFEGRYGYAGGLVVTAIALPAQDLELL